MAETEMVERVAKAMYDERLRRAPAAAAQFDLPWGALADDERRPWLFLARAAIKEMRREHTLEMQIAGMEALCLYNIEKDGPAKPHEECKTPDDWMERGANIAGRMQSGEGVSRVLNAMIDAALEKQNAYRG